MLVADKNGEAPIRYVVVDEEGSLSASPINDISEPVIRSNFDKRSANYEHIESALLSGVSTAAGNHQSSGVQCEEAFPMSFASFENVFLACQESGHSKEPYSEVKSADVNADIDLIIALKNHSGLIRCVVCDQRFTATDYYDHVKGCFLDKPFKCEVCGEEYNKDENLFVHHIIAHSEPNVVDAQKLECALCHKVFSRTSAYYGHLKQHFVSEVLSCSICKDEFEYMGLLNHHMRLCHIGSDEDCFDSSQICARCGIIIPNKSDMEKHILTHRKINKALKCPKRKKLCDVASKQHKCTICDKSFSKLYELTRHSVVHTKEKRFECNRCGKKFSQNSSMRQHMRTHVAGGMPIYKCELCDASFSQAGNLRRHVTLLHPADVSSRTVFRCPHCTCVFNSIQPLQVHMGKRHPDDFRDTSLGCSVEPSTSQNMSPSKVSGKRRLMCCSICGKAFAKSCDLVRHYRIHSGDRPFSCSQCAQKFALKSSLMSHLETHVWLENPELYVTSSRCPACMKQFPTPSSLRRHLKIHNKTTETCEICKQTFMSKKALEVHQIACVGDSTRTEMSRSLLDLSNDTQSVTNEETGHFRASRCNSFPASFLTSRSLKTTLDCNSGPKRYFCRFCVKSFDSPAQLKCHSMVHSNVRSFECGLCTKVFKDNAELKNHFEKDHRQEGQASSLIDETFGKDLGINDGLGNNFPSESNINGTELALQLFSFPAQDNTVRLPETGDNFEITSFATQNVSSCMRCPVCLFDFYSDGALVTHLLNMSTDDAHKYATLSCGQCLTECTGCVTLANHMKTAHSSKHDSGSNVYPLPVPSVPGPSQRKTHICDICGRGFTKPCDLTRHKRIHTGEKPFKCGVCERDFRVKSTLYQHMKVHDNASDNRHFCSVCSRCYSSTSALKLHLKLAHVEERLYKCAEPTCDQRFVTIRQRDVHVKRVHIEHKGEQQNSMNSSATNNQFNETLAQLTPSTRNARVIEQSQGSAFSPLNLQGTFNGPTHIALKIRPSAVAGNVEVQLSAFGEMISEDESIVIELSVLRPLVVEGLLLKIPIVIHFLSSDSFIAVDARRLLKLLEKKQTELMVVPLNVATEVTNLPVAVFAAAASNIMQPRETSSFITSCVICDEAFETPEQSDAHFQSEDHETAQLFSLSNLANHLGSHELGGEMLQYQSLPLRSAPTEVCKLCSISFENHESWLAHVRNEHVRDDMDFIDRSNTRFRRRTLN